jgi:ATP-dependent Lhr-like helicase
VTNEIAQHLFDVLRGSTNLVFANTREAVETFADALRRRSEGLRVPEEFFAHHGNLSKEHREWVEEALKDPQRRATAICTSTLEMGIDIGSAETVAQIGCPPSVASLKQRVGRSGRRNDPGKLELYAQEYERTSQSDLAAELRVGFVQTMAMVELMLDSWVEPGGDPGFNYSTLIHQVLSTIAQHGGARAEQLHRALCGPGPFALVDSDRFSQLLRAMGASKLLGQANDGTLLLGTEGERRTNHYSFYPVFQTTVEWRLVAAGKSLGTMPIAQPLIAGDFLIFGGRRWVILSADEKARLVELEPAGGGRVPRFEGSGVPQVADEVRRQMVRIYERSDQPEWLDSVAEVLLTEARGAWKAREMSVQPLRQVGSVVEVWPWAGDRRLSTAALALKSAGLKASKPFDSPSIIIENSTVDAVIAAGRQLVASAMPSATDLARSVENPRSEKWDWVLSDDLAWEVEGARHLNVSAAWELLDLIALGQWTVSA